jgi:hypothetical protein
MGGSRGIGSRHLSWAALFTCRREEKIQLTFKYHLEKGEAHKRKEMNRHNFFTETNAAIKKTSIRR